jgi:hypothetical protein
MRDKEAKKITYVKANPVGSLKDSRLMKGVGK